MVSITSLVTAALEDLCRESCITSPPRLAPFRLAAFHGWTRAFHAVSMPTLEKEQEACYGRSGLHMAGVRRCFPIAALAWSGGSLP
jgi:hypothetical protein